MHLALSINLVSIELAQDLRKRRIKSQDNAILYLKAAITELGYGKNADMQIVRAAWGEAIKHMAKSVRRKKPKQFAPGGFVPPGRSVMRREEGEFVIKLREYPKTKEQ